MCWFYMYGTGHPIPVSANKIYLGTIIVANEAGVFHVFEEDIE